jgi:hypothetical protein
LGAVPQQAIVKKQGIEVLKPAVQSLGKIAERGQGDAPRQAGDQGGLEAGLDPVTPGTGIFQESRMLQDHFQDQTGHQGPVQPLFLRR